MYHIYHLFVVYHIYHYAFTLQTSPIYPRVREVNLNMSNVDNKKDHNKSEINCFLSIIISSIICCIIDYIIITQSVYTRDISKKTRTGGNQRSE